ncbi:MAG TPA: GNAT family N-acetyltransferase [Armatimonadota bacterium]|nr:GNAT family N-acetyltransferase [Armatimonadota bacterium]
MEIERCTKEDFDQILTEIELFWGSDRTRPPHHPDNLNDFGDTAFVIREGGKVVAYLFGVIVHVHSDGVERVAYVLHVAVRPEYRRRGLARRLYSHFVRTTAARGCTSLHARTTADNTEAIRFHTSLGMQMRGTPNADGIPVVRIRSDPATAWAVFQMPISRSTRLG